MVARRKPAKLVDIRLSELSLVDKPANPSAKVTIFKRADDVEKKYESVSDLPESVRGVLPAAAQRQFLAVVNSAMDGGADDSSAFAQAWGALKNAGWHKNDDGAWVKKADALESIAKRWISTEDGARPFSEFLEQRLDCDRVDAIRRAVGSYIDSLDSTLYSVVLDRELDAEQKLSQMRTAVEDFMTSIRTRQPDIATEITKALSDAPDTEGDDDMPAALKAQLDELQKAVTALTEKIADPKAVDKADLAKQLEAVQKQITELAAKNDAADAERAELTAKAGMSDAEKAYMGTLDGKAKMDFMQATPEDRKKMMAKAADADPVVYKSESTGEEFRKSDDPRLVKMARQADEDRALAKSEREKRELAEVTKRADELLKSYAGEAADKVTVMSAVAKMDEKARTLLEKMLETGGKAIAAAFEKIGHNREVVAKTGADFEKRVSEVASRDKISKSAAMSRARQEFPEEFQAYQDAMN